MKQIDRQKVRDRLIRERSEVMDVSIASALKVLETGCPWEKARLTEETFAQISEYKDEEGEEFARQPVLADVSVPDKPARSNLVEIVAAGKMKSLGKAGSLSSRQRIVHSLAHIESWAIVSMQSSTSATV